MHRSVQTLYSEHGRSDYPFSLLGYSAISFVDMHLRIIFSPDPLTDWTVIFKSPEMFD